MNIEPARMISAAQEASGFLQALGQPTRLMILCRLAEGEMSVGKLADSLGLRQATVSQHLALLRREGLVATRREAQTVYYRIADERAQVLLETLYKLFCEPTAACGSGER
ncbi:MAG: ArsR family transcriptional regulator [Alphaproteobacteria bacterium]|nr:MAG: ArsR family transcriptional regulator [Alphaproteobacteria bacterium]